MEEGANLDTVYAGLVPDLLQHLVWVGVLKEDDKQDMKMVC